MMVGKSTAEIEAEQKVRAAEREKAKQALEAVYRQATGLNLAVALVRQPSGQFLLHIVDCQARTVKMSPEFVFSMGEPHLHALLAIIAEGATAVEYGRDRCEFEIEGSG